jgi:hypothetical protein
MGNQNSNRETHQPDSNMDGMGQAGVRDKRSHGTVCGMGE